MAWAKYYLRGISNLFFERDHHGGQKKFCLIFQGDSGGPLCAERRDKQYELLGKLQRDYFCLCIYQFYEFTNVIKLILFSLLRPLSTSGRILITQKMNLK